MNSELQYRKGKNYLSNHNLIFLVLFSLYFICAESAAIFCSINCQPNSCTTALANGCTVCSPYFVLAITPGPAACNFDTTQTSLKLSKIKTDFTISNTSTTTCTGAYSYNGNYVNNSAITLKTITPQTAPHYEVQLIVWVILIDQWQNTDFVQFSMVGLTITPTPAISPVSPNSTAPLCGTGNSQAFFRFSYSYPHTSTSALIQFLIKNKISFSSGRLGIGDVLLITKKCHAFCKACTGPASNVCSDCAVSYLLSGTECAASCLPTYGQNSSSIICISCDTYCLSCFDLATNCTTCKNTIIVGTNVTASQIYKMEDANTCVVTCPPGYFSFLATKNCLSCSLHCVNLSISSSIIGSNISLEYVFTFSAPMNFTSFNPWDFVVLTSSNASLDMINDFTILYTMVDDTHFKLTLTPVPLVQFKGVDFCATTKTQALTALQFSRDLYQLDSSVYGQVSCLQWTTPQVLLTLTGKILTDGACQFTFTFDTDMNFSSFDYTDFTSFSLDNFALTITGFTISYTSTSVTQFVLKVTPKTQTKFSNLKLCALTKSKNNTALKLSLNGTNLAATVYEQSECLILSTPSQTVFTQEEKIYYISLESLNNGIQNFTTQVGVQQFVKSGVFNLFMPGAQLSATVLIHNPRLSQNLYQGSRFWGSFVFFDVPPYQQNSSKTKYTFAKPNQQIISNNTKSRLLQTQTNLINQWKFQRTGHTGYFIIDNYIQILLIVICWVLFLIGWIYQHKFQTKPSKAFKFRTRIMVFFHKIHQVSFFYLILSALIEFKNFDSSYLHMLSMAISSVILCYFLGYELKIFYDMIGYPAVKIGTKQYQNYVQNYSIFIAYYRFEQYKDKNWNWRHFFRPYNYHTLTFLKKSCMLIAIPIFYEHGLAPVIILTTLQTLDLIRFVLTLPYHSNFRNAFYLGVQILLQIFFVCSLINQAISITIYNKYGEIANFQYETAFKNSGWLGMIFIFLYNIIYIIGTLVELLILIFRKNSLEAMVWNNRNQYYYQLYQHFQQYGDYYRLVKNYTDELSYNQQRRQIRSYTDWVNRFHDAEPIVDLSQDKLKVFKNIVQRGNIYSKPNSTSHQSRIQIKIQVFKIDNFLRKLYLSGKHKGLSTPKNQDRFLTQQTKSQPDQRPQRKQLDTRSMKNLQNSNEDEQISNFQIQYNIIPEVYKADAKKTNNSKKKIYIPKRIKNVINSDMLNPHFKKNLALTLISYQMPGTQQIKLTTFLKIDLMNYEEGQRIAYKREQMRQQIYIKKENKVHKIDLPEIIYGFPVDWQSLQK